jgi:hypothetical protein
MPTGTITDGALYTIENLLKTDYLDIIRDQFPEDQVLLKEIKRSSDRMETGGSSTKWALRMERNFAVGAFPDAGQLGVPGRQISVQATANLKNLYGRVRIEEKTIKTSTRKEWSFANKLKDEIKRIFEDLKADISRQLYGDGTGTLATVTGVSGTGTFADPYVLTVTSSFDPATKFFQGDPTATSGRGQRVSVLTSVGANQYIDAIVKSVTSTTVSIYNGTGSAPVATNIVTKPNAYNNELTGLSAIVNTGASAATFNNLFSVPTATYPKWSSFVRTTSEDPTEINLQHGWKEAVRQGAKIKFLITTFGVQSKYGTLLTPNKRYTNTIKLKGGFEGPEFNGVPMIADNYCPNKNLFYIDPEVLEIIHADDIGWMDQDGRQLKFVPDYAAYDAILLYFSEFITSQRNALTRHNNFNEL